MASTRLWRFACKLVSHAVFLAFRIKRVSIRARGRVCREVRTTIDRAYALTQSALLELLCGNAEDGARLAAQDAAVCLEQDVAFFLPLSRFLCGAALVEQGRVRRGLSEMLQGLAEQRALSGSFFGDIMLAFIAAAYRAERGNGTRDCGAPTKASS